VFVHYWKGSYEGAPYPATTWLFKPFDRFRTGFRRPVPQHLFGDFYATWGQSKEPSPYRPTGISIPSNYFPFTHLFFKPLSALSYNRALALFLVVTLGGVAAYVYLTLGCAGSDGRHQDCICADCADVSDADGHRSGGISRGSCSCW